MTELEQYKSLLQHDIDFKNKLGVDKYGIYYNNQRIAITNNDFVNYDSYKNAYKAIIQHGKYKGIFKTSATKFWCDVEKYKAAIDELLSTGELEIKIIQ